MELNLVATWSCAGDEEGGGRARSFYERETKIVYDITRWSGKKCFEGKNESYIVSIFTF